MKPIELTEANFQREVLESDRPVRVDFWAPWCGPCRMLGPVVEQIANERGDTVKVGKVNVDQNRALAKAFRIFSIPSVYVFENGKVKNTSVGLRDKASLEAMIA